MCNLYTVYLSVYLRFSYLFERRELPWRDGWEEGSGPGYRPRIFLQTSSCAYSTKYKYTVSHIIPITFQLLVFYVLLINVSQLAVYLPPGLCQLSELMALGQECPASQLSDVTALGQECSGSSVYLPGLC